MHSTTVLCDDSLVPVQIKVPTLRMGVECMTFEPKAMYMYELLRTMWYSRILPACLSMMHNDSISIAINKLNIV